MYWVTYRHTKKERNSVQKFRYNIGNSDISNYRLHRLYPVNRDVFLRAI